MTCAMCGNAITLATDATDDALHHWCASQRDSEAGWATTNRLMCDLLHRRKELLRLSEAERRDEVALVLA